MKIETGERKNGRAEEKKKKKEVMGKTFLDCLAEAVRTARTTML